MMTSVLWWQTSNFCTTSGKMVVKYFSIDFQVSQIVEGRVTHGDIIRFSQLHDVVANDISFEDDKRQDFNKNGHVSSTTCQSRQMISTIKQDGCKGCCWQIFLHFMLH